MIFGTLCLAFRVTSLTYMIEDDETVINQHQFSLSQYVTVEQSQHSFGNVLY